MALLLLAVMFGPMGCCCGGDGVAYTARERQEMHRKVWEYDCKQLNDDLDYLFLLEQPTRLSRWAIE
jgi:hypothetical protein